MDAATLFDRLRERDTADLVLPDHWHRRADLERLSRLGSTVYAAEVAPGLQLIVTRNTEATTLAARYGTRGILLTAELAHEAWERATGAGRRLAA